MFRQIQTQRSRLADEVYRQILDAIHKGAIGPEERIVQEKLAREFVISRTPVREALLRLEQEGVLETAGRGGFTIRTTSTAEVRELYQSRTAIEGMSARIVAELEDPARIAAIRRVIEREEAIQSTSATDYFNANRAIHRSIVEQTGNRYLLEMYDNIWNRGVSFHLFAAIEKVDLSKSLGEHMALCDAMEGGDPDKAQAAMIRHIEDGLDLQLEALALTS
ncbi:GntR family transcriptional regulator [Microbaculum marinum]|uniref:GntR family transcriptional regulator n=1 Tax=Microbaculum marinum TaxID=1764581 RepID=A0AAW9RA64_9HYPH